MVAANPRLDATRPRMLKTNCTQSHIGSKYEVHIAQVYSGRHVVTGPVERTVSALNLILNPKYDSDADWRHIVLSLCSRI